MPKETATTGRDSDKFMLRFPDGMRDQVAEAAKAAGRSMNAEIVARLQSTFKGATSEITVRLDAETVAEINRRAAASGRTAQEEMAELMALPLSKQEEEHFRMLQQLRAGQEKILEALSLVPGNPSKGKK